MDGVLLRFYTQENRRHDGQLLYQWLIDAARAMQLPGCSVFHASAGYGHHGQMHRERFFELQGELPVLVEFLLTREQAAQLLAHLHAAQVELFWSEHPARFGFLPADTL